MRGDISCACAAVVCVRSRACVRVRRVCAFTSVRALRRLVCVCAVCVLSRALWTFGPFPAATLTRRFTEAGSKHLNIVSFTQEHRNTQTDLGRNKLLNTNDNEFNTAAISLLWHAPPVLCCGQFNVADIRRR